MRVEHEYEQGGSLDYIVAWDCHRATILGRCVESTTIKSFDRLVDQVMRRKLYRDAQRVFWIIDNSAHRGEQAIERLEGRYPNLRLIDTPIHSERSYYLRI